MIWGLEERESVGPSFVKEGGREGGKRKRWLCLSYRGGWQENRESLLRGSRNKNKKQTRGRYHCARAVCDVCDFSVSFFFSFPSFFHSPLFSSSLVSFCLPTGMHITHTHTHSLTPHLQQRLVGGCGHTRLSLRSLSNLQPNPPRKYGSDRPFSPPPHPPSHLEMLMQHETTSRKAKGDDGGQKKKSIFNL